MPNLNSKKFALFSFNLIVSTITYKISETKSSFHVK